MNENQLWTLSKSFDDSGLPPEIRTLFFAGNGYLGIPAQVPAEGEAPGTYLNGFYETAPVVYGEKAYGYPAEKQVMVPVADIMGWEISRRDGTGNFHPLSPTRGSVTTDMARGIQVLEIDLTSPHGESCLCRVETLCDLTSPHQILSRLTLEGDGFFRITRRLSAPRKSQEETDDPRKGEALPEPPLGESSVRFEEEHIILTESTRHSGLSYRCAVTVLPETPAGLECDSPGQEIFREDRWADEALCLLHREGTASSETPLALTLGAVFFKTGDAPETEWAQRMETELSQIRHKGWEGALSGQRRYLDHLWAGGDIVLEKNPELTRALRFASYGLIQSVPTGGAQSGPAKGLSSDGYNGHYFWDADVYGQAALATLEPEKAESLVLFRIKTLKEARERAQELAEKGALYPWRTINGRESSAYFPAGTAQYHINADIIWGMQEYIRVTGEGEILLQGGAEMLFETARFWAGFAAFVPEKGYCFHCVTGPDEYTALVDNNFYTNLMAQNHLSFASKMAEELKRQHPGRYSELTVRMGLTEEETNHWLEIAAAVYLPFDKKEEIFCQDDGFLEKAPWNWDDTPREKRPLLLHYHPLKIYRHRVMKQPDVLLGMVLHRERFSREEFRRNFDFYEPFTSGDSSLTPAVQAAGAALGGLRETAERYLAHTAYLDLENREGNSDNGIHLAAMAGTRMALLYGFAGFRVTPGGPSFDLNFPPSWGEVTLSFRYRGALVRLDFLPESKEVILLSSLAMKLIIQGTMVVLEKGTPRRVSLE